jgi:hypothetical protein
MLSTQRWPTLMGNEMLICISGRLWFFKQISPTKVRGFHVNMQTMKLTHDANATEIKAIGYFGTSTMQQDGIKQVFNGGLTTALKPKKKVCLLLSQYSPTPFVSF